MILENAELLVLGKYSRMLWTQAETEEFREEFYEDLKGDLALDAIFSDYLLLELPRFELSYWLGNPNLFTYEKRNTFTEVSSEDPYDFVVLTAKAKVRKGVSEVEG